MNVLMVVELMNVWIDGFCNNNGMNWIVRCRWEDIIRIDVEGIDINAGSWVDSAQDRDFWRAVVNKCESLYIKLINSIAYGTRRFNVAFTRALE